MNEDTMIAYRNNNTTDARNDPRYESDVAFRAQYLCDQAKRMDQQAEELRKEAQRYRSIAAKLNPTRS